MQLFRILPAVPDTFGNSPCNYFVVLIGQVRTWQAPHGKDIYGMQK